MSGITDTKIRRFPTRVPAIADVLRQIEAEYREMPGLNITEAQAQRLWGLDSTTCKQALDALVHRGVLRRTHREVYVRAETLSRRTAVPMDGGASRHKR